MRLSLPERIPLTYGFLFAGSVFLMQQIEHTALYFSSCCFLFIVVAIMGFNAAGGLTRPSGGYLFFFATLTLVVGLCVKILLGEPADSHLLRPHLTITVYLVGICTMSLTALASRRFSRKRPLLETAVTDSRMKAATAGCLVIGVLLTILTHTLDRGQGTAFSALIQINRFAELAIILGVIDSIRTSGGQRSVSIFVLLAMASLFIVNGLLSFSKEGMFSPIACWTVAAASESYRIRRGQLVFLVLGLFFVSYYLVPYSQYGRTVTAPSLFGNIAVAEHLFETLPTVRAVYLARQRQEDQGSSDYFDTPQGLFDRLEMVSVDDKLIDATVLRGPEGLFPILTDFEAVVPHVFWPNKPAILWGNVYAHEAGINISEDDFSTGISFSPVGEGYHLATWAGLLLLCPAIWGMAFLFFDSLCGDVRRSPWGLLVLIYFAHAAPEGYLGGVIYVTFYVGFAIIFAALTAGYVMPIIGSLFIGQQSSHAGLRRSPLQARVRERQPLPASPGNEI